MGVTAGGVTRVSEFEIYSRAACPTPELTETWARLLCVGSTGVQCTFTSVEHEEVAHRTRSVCVSVLIP